MTTLDAEADAGEEHLHLLGRGVLGLVEDDEAGVERAAAHERERRHLHRLALEEALRALGFEHVVERVVERSEVRVDLGHEIARQEAEPLTGLDRGPGEDDALHLLVLEGLHGHGHRQPALAGAGRAEPERDHVRADGVDVALLAGRLRPHRAAPRRAQDLVGQHLARALGGAHHVDDATHVGAVDRLALLEQEHELLEQAADRLGVGAGDRDLVAAHVDGGVGEGVLDDAEQLVAVAEQARHQVVAGHDDVDRGVAHRRGGLTTRRRPGRMMDNASRRRPDAHAGRTAFAHSSWEPLAPTDSG